MLLCIVYLLTYTHAEPKAYDFMTRHFLVNKLSADKTKITHGRDDIVIVVVDAKSVEKYRWPWKRELYCKIFDYFNIYAAPKVLVHDAIITSPDTDNPSSDIKYFNAVKKMNNFAAGFLMGYQSGQNTKTEYDEEFSKKFSVNVQEEDTIPELFNNIVPFPKAYFDSINKVGSVNVIPGSISGNIFTRDEIVRNQFAFTKYKGSFYPSLAMQAFLLSKNPKEIIITKNDIQFPELNYKIKHKKTLFQIVTPIKFYKAYNTGYSHKSYSAIDIMESVNLLKNGKTPIINPEEFKDKIVIIGANVPAGDGLNDNKNSPISERHPGVDIQATVIDNILHNDFLFVIPQIYNLLITILCMMLIYLVIRSFNLVKAISGFIFIIFGYLFICAVCFYNSIIINVITPVILFVLTTIFAYTHKYVIENKNKEKVQNAMGKYMSTDVMKNVVKNIDNLGLGGKKAVVTVLFADIRGFTSMSEKMTAQQVSELLNEYFSEMEPIITHYNGIINKFIGDAVMAVFGEPIQDENHAQNAAKCAYAMLKRVEELHKKWAKEDKPEIEIGIGINTGEVFVGNIGSVNRMEYTVIGDTVNLASRLESYNKTYKTKILVSTSTYKYIRQIADVIKIPEVQIRGKSNKIDIYEVLKVKLD